MIGKEERGSDGSYPSSRSSSSSRSPLPSVEGPERLQGQGSEPGSLAPGLYLFKVTLIFLFHESSDPAYECA